VPGDKQAQTDSQRNNINTADLRLLRYLASTGISKTSFLRLSTSSMYPHAPGFIIFNLNAINLQSGYYGFMTKPVVDGLIKPHYSHSVNVNKSQSSFPWWHFRFPDKSSLFDLRYSPPEE